MTTDTLTCNQCGQDTHDDTSEVWSSFGRVCYDCAPPDEEEVA